MSKQELISYLDDGVVGLRELSYRPSHSDGLIRVGVHMYSRKQLEDLLAAVQTLSDAVSDE